MIVVSILNDKRVPWSDPQEWVVWLLLLVVATLIIHNGLRIYKENR